MPATAEPHRIPMTGAQRRRLRVELSAMPAMTATVTAAQSGAAWPGFPSGTSVSRPKTAGMALTGTSISTVPETVGVRMRRNQTIRAD